MTTRIGTYPVVLLGLSIGIAPVATASSDDQTTGEANHYAKAGSMVTVPIHVSDPSGSQVKGTLQAGTGGRRSLMAGANPPSIDSVSPSWGPPSGGTFVDIECNYLSERPCPQVRFGDALATIDNCSLTVAYVYAPPHVGYGAVDVTVTNPDNSSATLAGGYRYADGPPPDVTSVSPSFGSGVGNQLVHIIGGEFRDGAHFDFGDAAGTIVNLSSSAVDVYTPPHDYGLVDVTVTNTDTTQGTLADGYAYTDVDLTGKWMGYTLFGAKVKAKFAPRNKGTASSHAFIIKFYESTHLKLDSLATLIGTFAVKKGLGAGKTGQTISIQTKMGLNKYVIAAVNPDGQVLEYDYKNNTLALKVQ